MGLVVVNVSPLPTMIPQVQINIQNLFFALRTGTAPAPRSRCPSPVFAADRGVGDAVDGPEWFMGLVVVNISPPPQPSYPK